MTQHQFPNRYTEVPLQTDKKLNKAFRYVSRQITKLPPCPWMPGGKPAGSCLPVGAKRCAPIFGNVEVSRTIVSEEDIHILSSWPDADHAHITFGWTLEGPFYQGEIWENEPELIVVEVYKFGMLLHQCEVCAFVHENLLFRSDMLPLANRVFAAKLASKGRPEANIKTPIELLGYKAMIASWPKDILCDIEEELGEYEMLNLSALKINKIVAKQRLKSAIAAQSFAP